MKKVILLAILTISKQLVASDFKLLEPNEVSIDYIRVLNYRPDYYTEDSERFVHGANFNLNVNLMEYIYWDNRVHFLGTDSQIRQGGWEYTVGFDFKYVKPFYYHHSQHVMERSRDTRSFPLEDMYGIRMQFYKRD